MTQALRSILEKVAEQAPCDGAALGRFAEHLQELPPYRAARINPFEFAEATGIDPETTLNLFVRGAKHGLFDLTVRTVGDIEVDSHHTIEDTGIVIGECLREALGKKEGIRRYGCAYLPMDETLARVVVDLSNRPHLEFRAPAGTPSAPNMPFTLVEEFCRAVASNLRANVHVELLYGRDGLPILVENIFLSAIMFS